jgi:predicted small integral membrane protein
MYNVLAVLFPYLLVFYIIDCFILLKNCQVAFFSTSGDGFHFKRSGLHPIAFSPTSEVYFSHKMPLLLSTRGIYLFAPSEENQHHRRYSASPRFLRYHGIQTCKSDENKIIINGKPEAICPNDITASQTAEFIRELIPLSENDRHSRIQTQLSVMTSWEEINKKRNETRGILDTLKLCGGVLFVEVFIAFPVIVFSELRAIVNPLYLLVLLSITYLLTIFTAGLFISKRVGFEKKKLVISLLLSIISPVGALHLTKEFSKHSLWRFDYLTLAASLLPVRDMKTLFREELLALSHARGTAPSEDLEDSITMRENALAQLLLHRGITPDKLFSPPEKQDKSAAKYCPVCLTEYLAEAGQCSTCQIPLKAF